MRKTNFKEIVFLLAMGVGMFLALAFTDFGLSGAALAGAFTMLAVVLETRRSGRRCSSKAEL